MPLTEPFDSYNELYENWFEKHFEIFTAEINALKHLFTPVEKALEVGIGTGRFAEKLGIKLGVEPSEAMARTAMQKGLTVVKGTAEKLPFFDESMNMILMVTVVCFVDSINLSLKEAYRVLKPDGYVLIGFVPLESYLGQKHYSNRDGSRFYGQAHFYSTDEMLTHLKNTGFSEIKTAQTLIGDDMSFDLSLINNHDQGSFVVIRANKVTIQT